MLQIPQNPTKNYHFPHLNSPEDMTATKHPLSFPIPISCDDWINDRVFSLKNRRVVFSKASGNLKVRRSVRSLRVFFCVREFSYSHPPKKWCKKFTPEFNLVKIVIFMIIVFHSAVAAVVWSRRQFSGT